MLNTLKIRFNQFLRITKASLFQKNIFKFNKIKIIKFDNIRHDYIYKDGLVDGTLKLQEIEVSNAFICTQ